MKKTIMVLLGCGALLVAGCGKDENPVKDDPDAIDHIKIMSMAGGEGIVVSDMSIVKDDTLELYAAGFNDDDEYVRDVVSTWQATVTEGGIGAFVDSTGSSVRLVVSQFGKGSVRATTDAGETDVTGTLTALPGAPSDIVSSIGNSTVSLSWTASISGDIDGYLVYVVDDTTVEPLDADYDLDPESTAVTLAGLAVGDPKYVYVRAWKRVAGQFYESLNSEILYVASRPYFSVTDTMYAYEILSGSSVNSAYGWDADGNGAAFSMAEANRDTIDFYTKLINDTVYLFSPNTHIFMPSLETGSAETWFYDMGEYAFSDAAVSQAPVCTEETPWKKGQVLLEGHVYAAAFKTAGATDYNYVKIRVVELNEAATVPYFLFEYGYQTAPGVTLFKK